MKYMWLVFALSGAITAAAVVALSKAGLKNVPSTLAFAIQAIFILIISWGAVFWKSNFTEIYQLESKAWIFLVLAGLLSGLSSLFTFEALKLGDASVVSPIERLSLVFTIIFAVIFLKEKLNWQLVLGAILMITGAIIIAFTRKI